MRNYELTFIIDPVLSNDEIAMTASTYIDHLEAAKCEIVYINEWGLRQLAYPINKRNTGIYYTIEFASPDGGFIDKLELALRRDVRIIRFLSVKLDKFGVQYNEDKRAGKIGAYKKQKEADRAAKDAEAKKKAAQNKKRRGNAPIGGGTGAPAPKPRRTA
jgi:small subunit ribosomal protein S6